MSARDAGPRLAWPDLAEALEAMRCAPDLDTLADVAAPLSAALEVRVLALGKVVPAAGGPSLQLLTGVFPSRWRERYEAARFGPHDPLARSAPPSDGRQPFAEVLGLGAPGAPVRLHYEAAQAQSGEVLWRRRAPDPTPWLVLLAGPHEAPDLETAAQRRLTAEAFLNAALARIPAENAPPRLTARQRACLAAAGLGRNSQQIGADLRLAPKTVDAYLAAAAARLGARNRIAAVTAALRWGLL